MVSGKFAVAASEPDNHTVTVPLLVLGVVVVLIAVRQVGSLRLQIWQAMVAGAVAMLVTGSLTPAEALRAVDLDVMLFLFGMFVLGRALEDSGVLADLSHRLFSRAASVDTLVLLILTGAGVASAVAMNDTVAVVGTPVVVALALAHGVRPQVTLLALAFAVTAGSVPSPIGNPQNLLVALADAEANPFVTFARWLAVPAAGALALTYLALRLAYRSEFHRRGLVHARDVTTEPRLARAALVGMWLLLALIAVRVALVAFEASVDMPLTVIAVVPAAAVLMLAPARVRVVRGVDWATLAFFVGLFVVVEAVDQAGVTREVVARLGGRVGGTAWMLAVSGVVSQAVSNVPLVALYLPALAEAGTGEEARMALAAGSTLAGTFTILGAASNVIIVDNAERRFGVRVGFWEFARVGIPLGVAQMLLTWGWLALVG